MSAPTLYLRIVSPEAVLHDGPVQKLRFPGQDGSFGVLPRHAPMVALTDSGLLRATAADGKTREFVIHDGFAEVRDNVVTVLTRSAERPGEIDLQRAREAAQRARERLRSRAADLDLVRAYAALRRALMRSRYAQQL